MHLVVGQPHQQAPNIEEYYNYQKRSPYAKVHYDLEFLSQFVQENKQLQGKSVQEALNFVFDTRYKYINNGLVGFCAEYAATTDKSMFVYMAID